MSMTSAAAGQADKPPTRPSPWETDAPAPSATLFEAVLEPHRSLSPKAFRRLMIAVSLLSLVPSTILWLNHAWPCVGFLGLDILLLYIAFKASYRHARLFERIRLTASELGIERVWPNGAWQRWTLEPYWARVEVERRGEHDCRMEVVSRGQRVTLGAFLPPEEREAIADALKAALARRPLPSNG
jgi:uncharacterized membrane protein